MDRRQFLAVMAGSTIGAPLGAMAESTARMRRIGFLWDRPTVWPHALAAFRRGLLDLGWIEGKNIAIEYRWAEGRFDRLHELAEMLVRLKVDVIVAPTSIYAGAAKRATTAIPVVFVSHADPVGSGHVASLARPGGNITGLTIMMSETSAKSVEILREAVPGLVRVAVIWDPKTPSHVPGLKAVESAGRALGIQIVPFSVRSVAELDRAFTAMERERTGAVLVLSTPLFLSQARKLAELALTRKLPTIFAPREHAEAGGLFSYGPDRADLFRRAATYVDKILRGTRPADLPVQQATTFELVINLSTAEKLGLKIPPSMLVQASELLR